MLGKAALVLGLGTGYVFGTRDGRERYEQIKTHANRVWNDPKVQELAKKTAPQAQEKVAAAARKASSKASSSKANRKRSREAAPTPPPPGAASPPSSPTDGDL